MQHKHQLIEYLLFHADNALILGHRNSEWCGHGPVLEQDIALTNISLDLIGQARYFYQYVAELMGGGASEDSLAYLRDAREYRNALMLELPKGDWGFTVLRQFLFSQYQYLLFQRMQDSRDERLAAIASRAIKEAAYHLRWSSEWVIRLGDGTAESHARIATSVDQIWPYTGEMFVAASGDRDLAEQRIISLADTLQSGWTEGVRAIFSEAGLKFQLDVWQQGGGRSGEHTEHLGFILAEMQFLQRAYPGAQW